jgi:chemotaxis protein MotB
MADEEAKEEEVKPNQNIDPDEEGLPVEEEAAAPVGPAPIIKKKKLDADHAGAHGGAWKIALADMMTAMMAFFLLMWLLGATSDAQRKSIADYFRPTSHSAVAMGERPGPGGLIGGFSVMDSDAMPYAGKTTSFFKRETPRSEAGTQSGDGKTKDETKNKNPEEISADERAKIAAEADQKNFDKLEKEVKQSLAMNKELEKIKDQVKFVREKDGLRIEIIDKADFSMFGLGTNKMQAKAFTLIREVAKSLATMPNKVAVRGHTDSLAYDDGVNSNWSLSGMRAEATRRLLAEAGLPPSRFYRIEGVADTVPDVPHNTADPRNRRISITILYQDQTPKG